MVHEREEFLEFLAKLPEIDKKLDKIEKMTKTCDPRVIDVMTDINVFLEKNRKFSISREWRKFVTDVNYVKTNFMDDCICRCPRRR